MTIVEGRETSKENIDSTLNLIYNLGDKDECSSKHLGHCLAAIASGKTHRQAVAYATPWGGEPDEGQEGVINEAWDIDEREAVLEKYWEIIETEYNKVGEKEFHEIIEEFQEPYYSDCLVYYSQTEVSLSIISRDVIPSPPPSFESSPISEESPTACSISTSQILGIMI